MTVLLVLLVSLAAALPLAPAGLVATDDGVNHIFRMWEFNQVLSQGVLYPRWAPDFVFGLGYPLFNFYAPLIYYLGAAIHVTGVGFIEAFKVAGALSTLLGGLFLYLYVRDFLPPRAALLAAALYTLAPYHLLDLYLRGALPEHLAFAWLPLMLWSGARLAQRGGAGYLLLLATALAGLVYTHNLSALLLVPLVAAHGGVLALASAGPGLGPKLHRLAPLAAAGLLGLALSTAYWLPALGELNEVQIRKTAEYDFHDHFVPLERLVQLAPLHYYGRPGGDESERFIGFSLGAAQALPALAGLAVLALRRGRLGSRVLGEGVGALLAAAATLMLATPLSTAIWEEAPLLATIQFPWRLLQPATWALAVLGGIAALALPPLAGRVAVGLAVAWALVGGLAQLPSARTTLHEGQLSALGSMAEEAAYGVIGTSGGEFLPRAVLPHPFSSPVSTALFAGEERPALDPRTTGTASASILELAAERQRYRVSVARPQLVVFNLFYFPGWEARVDHQPSPVGVTEGGLLALDLGPGEQEVELTFRATPLRAAATLVTIAALLLVAVLAATAVRRMARSQLPPTRHLALATSTAALVLLAMWATARLQRATSFFPRQPLDVELEGLAVAGFELRGGGLSLREGVPAVSPGAPLELVVHWRLAEGQEPPPNVGVVARLLSYHDYWSEARGNLPPLTSATQAEPTTVALPVPAGLPPNAYHVEFDLVDLETERPLGQKSYQYTPVLRSRWGLTSVPLVVGGGTGTTSPAELTGRVPDNAAFEGGPRLLAFEARQQPGLLSGDRRRPLEAGPTGTLGALPAGQVLHLDFTWRAPQTKLDDLVVSARLVDSLGRRLANHDDRPAQGTYPSYLWRPGHLVRDQTDIRVPPEAPPDRYRLELALIGSDRAPLALGPGRHAADLGHIQVIPPLTPGQTQIRPGFTSDFRTSGLRLVGYAVSQQDAQPGDELTVVLYWQATDPIERDVEVELRASDPRGTPWHAVVEPPGGAGYPTSRWTPGTTVKAERRLRLPARTSGEEVILDVRLLDAATRTILGTTRLAALRLEQPRRSFVPPAGLTPRPADFGALFRLLGYLAPASDPWRARPGEELRLRLVWQALAEMDRSYAISVQLLDRAGRLVAQHDSMPALGAAQTAGWLPGQVVEDEHPLRLPEQLAPERYTVLVLAYDPATGQRLPTAGGDSVVLGELEVR